MGKQRKKKVERKYAPEDYMEDEQVSKEVKAERKKYADSVKWSKKVMRKARKKLDEEEKSKLNEGMFSSNRGDWRSPKNLLKLVRTFGRPHGIGLDPCGHPASFVKAKVEWCGGAPSKDGLVLSWAGNGLVYANPPYGRAIVPWVRKAAWEGTRENVEIVLLTPARTDTRWWQDYITLADVVCFWKGRLKFVGADSGAPFPSALVYWGPRAHWFSRVFKKSGWVVPGGWITGYQRKVV